MRDLLAGRGITVDAATIYRWVQKFGPELRKRAYGQHRSWRGLQWHVCETYVRVKGRWCYHPVTIVTDKAHSYAKAIEEMNFGNGPDDRIRHIDRKHLNNRIEADHAALKKLLRPNEASEKGPPRRTH
ncbi:DDE domain protein (plasmid) [Antarctobacter heliothermus]|uniref:DDE domain protein n=1 Tax=Antarctobacter heliothermus TaxID=74033 RepID=A0A222EAJ8_9RHOB|nr:DDE-type integrase/transposase/recombinase [Antarctobacter heliothermus]ASP23192.1 DDE domain protein [Antarctobacter heliothermus]